jgi:hypothetical protein
MVENGPTKIKWEKEVYTNQNEGSLKPFDPKYQIVPKAIDLILFSL